MKNIQCNMLNKIKIFFVIVGLAFAGQTLNADTQNPDANAQFSFLKFLNDYKASPELGDVSGTSCSPTNLPACCQIFTHLPSPIIDSNGCSKWDSCSYLCDLASTGCDVECKDGKTTGNCQFCSLKPQCHTYCEELTKDCCPSSSL